MNDDIATAAPGNGTGTGTPDDAHRDRTGSAAPLAAWAFAFLVLRIFAVSGYDWDTAFAVSVTIGLDDGLPMRSSCSGSSP